MPAQRISEFDLWQPGYAGAVVRVYIAGGTTLASIYTDEALSVAASNPQTLSSTTINGDTYGKFAAPLYTSSAYYLDIDSTDQTGIVRPPLTTLAAQDASDATVTPTGATVATALDNHLARVIWAEDHGAIGAVAATNTTTLTTAIGIAAAQGGGIVMLPDNASINFNQITISAGVILCGAGRSGSPTVLQSQTADKCITLGGDGAGLMNLVVDGVNKVASGIGIYSKAKDETVLQNVLVKRFETGIHQKGGRRANWKDFYIDACTNGAKLHGDTDAGGGADGDQWRNNRWIGGVVSTCTSIGVELSYEDAKCYENTLAIGFETNTGTGLKINGARFTDISGSWFSGNTTTLACQDDTLSTVTDNTLIGLKFANGSMTDGAVTFNGLSQDIVFDGVALSNVDFTLTNVTSNILLRDCTEDSQVTIAGNGTRITRSRAMFGDAPASSVTTTDATALKAWEITLEPGQKAWIEARILGVGRNVIDYGMYHISRAVHRPGSALAYDAQTANFTVGLVITGATSGATARITADADGGGTGTLTVKDIIGVFLDNEIITDSSTGSATVNGTLTHQNAALLGSTVVVSTAVETVAGYAADFAAAAGNIEIQVTGAAATTLEWTVEAKVTVN